MITSKKMLTLAGALCLALPSAMLAETTDYTPVKFNQTEDPVFPRSLVTAGIKSGAASVAVAVDENGRMTDYLVTAYSHPAFAESALAALKKWTFEPMRIHGAARNSKTDLTFRFEVEGVVVVSMSALESADLIRFRIAPGSEAYSTYRPQQLSHAPKPTKVVNPAYTRDLALSSHGGKVSVEFYIDEQGHVRMPSVSRETNDANEELAAMVVSTVAQWEFEPPLSDGKPVLVRAQQSFNFKAPST